MFGFFKSKINSILQINNFNVSKLDYKEVPLWASDDLNFVISRFCSLFNESNLKVYDGEIESPLKTKELFKLFRGVEYGQNVNSFFKTFIYETLIYGSCFLYVKKGSKINNFIILKNNNIDYTSNHDFNFLETENYLDRFSKINYMDNGNTFEVKENSICFVDNVGDVNSFPCSRFDKIRNYINLSFYRNKGLIQNFNRINYGFITPKINDKIINFSTTGQEIERKKNELFQEQNNVAGGVIRHNNIPIEFVDTTLDIQKAGFLSVNDDILTAICNILGIQKEVLSSGGTTFNNQSGAKKDAITGVMDFADSIEVFFNNFLQKENFFTPTEVMMFDFTETLKINLATTSEEINTAVE